MHPVHEVSFNAKIIGLLVIRIPVCVDRSGSNDTGTFSDVGLALARIFDGRAD